MSAGPATFLYVTYGYDGLNRPGLSREEGVIWLTGVSYNPDGTLNGFSAEAAVAGRPQSVRGQTKWRRGRDSNPRNACALNGFRDRPVRPLRHLSACEADRR